MRNLLRASVLILVIGLGLSVSPNSKEIKCDFKGVQYKESDEIFIDLKGDPCKRCICTADWDPSNPSPCLTALCAPKPIGCTQREGECCKYDCPPTDVPVQPGITCKYNGVVYKEKDEIAVDPVRNPCKKCICTKNWNPLKPFPCFSPLCARIPDGCIQTPGECCKYHCPGNQVTCEFNGVSYKENDRIAVDPKGDPCKKCVCTRGWDPKNPSPCFTAACAPIPRFCKYKPGTCCGFECPKPPEQEITCVQNGITYKENDKMVDPQDPCTECICTKHWDPLNPSPCISALCVSPQEGCTFKKGKCCEYECPVNQVTCEFNGVIYKENDQIAVDPKGDPCKKCICKKGWNPRNPSPCFTARCAPIPRFCKYKPGTCCGFECPQPPNQEITCVQNGITYKENDKMVDPEDPCTECTCTKYWNPLNPSPCISALCVSPQEGCTFKKGKCCEYECPASPVTCEFNGVIYKENDRIAVDPKRDPCKKCICKRGWDPRNPSPCYTATCAPIPRFCKYKSGTCCGFEC